VKASLNLTSWIFRYKLFRALGMPGTLPISVTVSVTNMCNSRCKTCFIWKLYHDHPELKGKEFKTWEFEKTFESLGEQVVWATISGGEPYLRSDLPEICEVLCQHCNPSIVNISTNALLSDVIEDETKKILERCEGPTFILNLSLDGVGPRQDEVRGVPGNFQRFLDTYRRLKRLKAEFPSLRVGIHSVVSRYSINDLFDVYEYAKQLDPDSYITEVAEKRTELFTADKDITPSPDAYAKFVNKLSNKIRNDYLHSKKSVSKITQAFRLTYYQIAAQELREHRQIIPCYAGYASCQITPYGDVWPCCILGYDKPIGSLRETDYDFRKIWFSEKADEIRKYIKSENCACPLANAHYTNILCNFRSMLSLLRTMMKRA